MVFYLIVFSTSCSTSMVLHLMLGCTLMVFYLIVFSTSCCSTSMVLHLMVLHLMVVYNGALTPTFTSLYLMLYLHGSPAHAALPPWFSTVLHLLLGSTSTSPYSHGSPPPVGFCFQVHLLLKAFVMCRLPSDKSQ